MFDPLRGGNRTSSVAAPEASMTTMVKRVSSNKGSIWPYSRPVKCNMRVMVMMKMDKNTCLIVQPAVVVGSYGKIADR